MKQQGDNYFQEITVQTSARNAFLALTEQIDLWWGETDTKGAKIGDEFTVSFGEASWSFRVTTLDQNSKLIWECIGGNPDFNAEWIGDTLHWNINEDGDSVKISLLQIGLTPDMNCFEICNRGWNHYITNSLSAYLKTGKGELQFAG